jgi:hypothetical protein
MGTCEQQRYSRYCSAVADDLFCDGGHSTTHTVMICVESDAAAPPAALAMPAVVVSLSSSCWPSFVVADLVTSKVVRYTCSNQCTNG